MLIFLQHVALSRETLSRGHLPAARPLLCYSVGSLQSLVSPLHRPGPSVCSCSGTLHDLSAVVIISPIVVFLFLGRFIPCVPAVFTLAFALRLHTDLRWHRIAVSVLLCSRDLEDFLSHLREDGKSPWGHTHHCAKAQRLFPSTLLTLEMKCRAEYR